MRPTRDSVNIRIAQIIAERGTCERLKVGAVITINNHIVSTGYNGPAKGTEHCNPFSCNTDNPCSRAVHAEMNAIENLPHQINHDMDYVVLYCTHQPCLNCATEIINNLRPNRVCYTHPYRDISGLNILLQHGIQVIRLDEQGNPQ